MKSDIAITAKLPRHQAQALLQQLRAEYSMLFNEHWYDDRFRLVPEGARHGSLLVAYPVLAAKKRLIGALKHSLDTAN